MSLTLDQVGVNGPPDSWKDAPQYILMPTRLIDTLKKLQTWTKKSNDDPDLRHEFGLFVALHEGFVMMPDFTCVEGVDTRKSGQAKVNMGPRVSPKLGYHIIGVAHSHPVEDKFSSGDVWDFWGRPESDWMSFVSTPNNIWMILRTKKTTGGHNIPPSPPRPNQDSDILADFEEAREKVYKQQLSTKNAEMYATVDMVRIMEIVLYRLDHKNDKNLLKKLA